ncbi:hypothetical protein D3C80_2202720 [compost metagenome]
MNQLRALLVSAPQDVRERLWKSKPADCAKGCARVRSLGTTELLHTLTTTLCLLGKLNRPGFSRHSVVEH